MSSLQSAYPRAASLTHRLIGLGLALACLLAISGSPAQAQVSTPQSTAAAQPFPGDYPWQWSFIDGSSAFENYGESIDTVLDPLTARPYIVYSASDAATTWLRLATYVGAGGNCSAGRYFCEDVEKVPGKRIGINPSIDVRAYQDILPGNPAPVIHRSIGIAYVNETDHTVRFAERTCDQPGCPWTIGTIAANDNAHPGMDTVFKFGWNGGPDYLMYTLPAMQDVPMPPFGTPVPIPVHSINLAARVGVGGDCGPYNFWDCTNIEGAPAFVPSTLTGIDLHVDAGGVPTMVYTFSNTLTITRPDSPNTSCATREAGGSIPWRCYRVDNVSFKLGEKPYVSVGMNTSANPATPFIAYHKYNDASNANELYLAEWVGFNNDSGCTNPNGYRCFKINTMGSDSGTPTLGLSLAVGPGGGTPVIAYSRASGTDDGLYIAYPSLLAGNCGPTITLPGGMSLHTWVCKAVDLYGAGGRFASIEADPTTGLLTIAHHNTTALGSVELQQQRIPLFLPYTLKP